MNQEFSPVDIISPWFSVLILGDEQLRDVVSSHRYHIIMKTKDNKATVIMPKLLFEKDIPPPPKLYYRTRLQVKLQKSPF
jgi:hypothetical protein